MKNFTSILLASALVFTAFLTTLHAQDEQILRKFENEGFEYGYEAWEQLADIQTTSPTGVKLEGSAGGGAGAYFQQIADISDANKLAVNIQREPGNTATVLILKLLSSDGGGFFQVEVPLADVSDSEFTTLTVDLPKKGEPGYDQLEEIKGFQIQGNFYPDQKVLVTIASVSATAAPEETESAKPTVKPSK